MPTVSNIDWFLTRVRDKLVSSLPDFPDSAQPRYWEAPYDGPLRELELDDGTRAFHILGGTDPTAQRPTGRPITFIQQFLVEIRYDIRDDNGGITTSKNIM